MNYSRNILITGGAGFIGSHVVRLFVNRYPDYRVVNYDALTYAGNPDNLLDVKDKENYVFVKGDISDAEKVKEIFEEYNIDSVIHLAAESHVDRSIEDPLAFVRTNVIGTVTLLDCARKVWESRPEGYEGKLFYHISTDEVFGALPIDCPDGFESPLGNKAYGKECFTETTAYDPRSPYSAAKASSNHFVSSYHHTYGMPVVITSCSNNYGPNQFPEKLIPLFINNIIERKPLPVYGEGLNVRDWLYVEDHARAIDTVFHKAVPGSYYNIGGCNEWRNIDLIHELIKAVDEKLGNPAGFSSALITFVTDRKGHDLRYSIDSSRIREELGWAPSLRFEDGLRKTVDWYLSNSEWLRRISSGEYRNSD